MAFIKALLIYLTIAYVLMISAHGSIFNPGLADYFQCDRVHIVQKEETCLLLSMLYNIPYAFLRWRNNLSPSECSHLRVGTKLCIVRWV